MCLLVKICAVWSIYLQLVSILPDIIQADDIGMFEQLHDCYLSLQAVWNWFMAGRTGARTCLSTFDEVGQTLSARGLGSSASDDLDCAILMSRLVSNDPDPRTSTLTNGLS